MSETLSRRSFTKQIAMMAGVAAAPPFLHAAKTRNIPIGYTGITFRNSDVEQAIQVVSDLGFYGFETFGEVLTKWEGQGGLEKVLQAHNLPLISGYCTLNLTDATKRTDEMAKAVAWSKLIKQCNGRVFVLGPNQVKRDSYDYAANKSNIIQTLNEAAKAVTDQGLTPVLHQHTGTCIMTKDETYATLDAVDTRVLKFGPDVGQLTKGGVDAIEVIKHYLPIVQHMHLKDYAGTDEHLLGYCPLGQGKVNVPAILDIMQGRKISGMIMVELDNNFADPSPTPPAQLVQESQSYLKSIGVKFRK